MQHDSHLPFDLRAVAHKNKKVSIAFDGGLLSSNGGVLLLRGVERRLGITAANRWLLDRVYAMFSRVKERRESRGTDLSGTNVFIGKNLVLINLSLRRCDSQSSLDREDKHELRHSARIGQSERRCSK